MVLYTQPILLLAHPFKLKLIITKKSSCKIIKMDNILIDLNSTKLQNYAYTKLQNYWGVINLKIFFRNGNTKK